MITSYLRLAWNALFRKRLYTLVSLFGITFTLSILFVGTSLYDYVLKPNYPEYKQDRILVVDEIIAYGISKLGTSSSWGALSYDFIQKYILPMKAPGKIGMSVRYGERTVYMNNHKFVFTIWQADAAYWEIFDFECIKGKLYGKAEIDANARVAVISESTARKYFGSVELAIGEMIKVDKESYQVIGVVKDVPKIREITYGDIWLPLVQPETAGSSTYLGSNIVYILAPTESAVVSIRKELLDRISHFRFSGDGQSESFSISPGYTIPYSTLLPFINTPAEIFFRNNFRKEKKVTKEGYSEQMIINKPEFDLLLMLSIALLMAFPAINLININIARYLGRTSEIGIRRSYGAKKLVILRQLLIENLLITAIGSIMAIIVTFGLLKLLEASDLMPGARFILNFRILGWGVVFVLLFNLISGIVPAWKISRLQIVQSLKGGES